MNIVADLHLHTIASQHAYSTITEYAKFAFSNNLKVIGITDHGPAMTDGPFEYYFMNLRILPDYIEGVRVLKGIELNILDDEGAVDLRSTVLSCLDYAIASYHPGTSPAYYTKQQFTNGYINVMDKNKVRILGHIDNPAVPIDYEAVLLKAKEKNVLIEVNNASYGYIRPGSYELGLELFTMAKKIGNKIILNSDSHYHEQIGMLDKSIQLVKEIDYPEELIVNTNINKFKEEFNV